MSQFPTQPTPPNRSRRSMGFDFGQAQPTQRDVVPFASSGPDYSASRQLSGLNDSLNSAIGAAGRFAAGVNQEREQADKQAKYDAAKLAEDQQRAERNAAALRSAELDPQLRDQLERGTIAPLPGESLEDFKNKVLTAYTTDAPPAYRDEMNRILGPRLIGYSVEMAQKGRIVAERNEDDGTVARALFAPNAAAAQAIIDDAAFSTGNTPARVQSIQTRIMLAAAENGNKPLVEAMQSRLGDSAPEQVIKANNALVQHDIRAKTEQREAFYNNVDALILQQAPIEAVASFIDNSGMEPNDKLRAIRTVRGEYADQIRQSQNATEDAFVQGQIDQTAAAVLTGGTAFRPLIAPINLPSGRTVSNADRDAKYRQSFQRQTGFNYGDLFSDDPASIRRSRAYMVAVTDIGVGDPAFASIGKRVSLAADDIGTVTQGDQDAVSAFRKARAFGVATMLFDNNDPSYTVLDNASRMIDRGGQPNGLTVTPKEAILTAKRQYADGLLNKGVTSEDTTRAFNADPSLTPQQAQRVARTAKNYGLTSTREQALEDAMKAELVDTTNLLIPSGPQKFWDIVNPLNANPFDFLGQVNSPAFGTREGKRFDLGVLATSDETTKTAIGAAAGVILSRRVDEAAKKNPLAGITADSFYLHTVAPGVWSIREVGNGVALPNDELNRTVTATELSTIAQAYTRVNDKSLPSAMELERLIAATEAKVSQPGTVAGPGGLPPSVFYQQELDSLRRDLKVRKGIDMMKEWSKTK